MTGSIMDGSASLFLENTVMLVHKMLSYSGFKVVPHGYQFLQTKRLLRNSNRHTAINRICGLNVEP
ncbi:MAG TPA: hypothetical protein DCZ69_01040 [Syntrophobacteraceae bacterium]|nr:hypothetical protein [Syntrophobacteraceae bacterium]HBD06820.1 hypothetical protein [Syntrophobacteraceae bacterium]HBZ55647.1 hypothetical protein [Syntrophobacteraceae bacterium]